MRKVMNKEEMINEILFLIEVNKEKEVSLFFLADEIKEIVTSPDLTENLDDTEQKKPRNNF